MGELIPDQEPKFVEPLHERVEETQRQVENMSNETDDRTELERAADQEAAEAREEIAANDERQF